MTLTLNEEQQLLKKTAEDFFREHAPISALRKLRDQRDNVGYCRDHWGQMIELGWPATIIPEEYGGIDYGFVGLGLIIEAAGRTLVSSPLLSTVVLSTSAILKGGTSKQRSQLLPLIAKGELIIALAFQEGPHHKPNCISTQVEKTVQGFVLNGDKVFVVDGHIADKLIIAARTSGAANDTSGISLFLIDRQQAGVQIDRSVLVDSRNYAQIHLKNVTVADDSLIGELNAGYTLLEQVIDIGNIALAAEMLGSMQEAFERTLNYLKQREQFGVPIGSFQALQHRAAQMFCEIELCKSVVLKALQALDKSALDKSSADNNTPNEHTAEIALLASLAKVQTAETLKLVSCEAIQMFGGMGMTDEEEIGFFIKRARVAQQLMGDENYHLQRYASLKGY